MTARIEKIEPSWLLRLQSGTASALTSIFGWRGSANVHSPTQRSRPAHLQVSPGVSDGARLVQETVADLVDGMEYWQEALQYVTEDVEENLVVLLPPKRQYIVNVQIIARQRPDLLIVPEDFAGGFVDVELTE